MPRRIGLVGGECSGKSALAAALARTLPACVVTEALRDFVEREGRPPGQHEQQALLAEQAAREDAVAATCALGTVVADPAPLMTAVYSLVYFDDGGLLPAALEHARGYDLVVWCDPGIPWVADDGQRDGPERRAQADAVLARIVREDLTSMGVPVLRVVGDPADRAEAVRRAWLPGTPDGRT